jgi:hypothetical protein
MPGAPWLCCVRGSALRSNSGSHAARNRGGDIWGRRLSHSAAVAVMVATTGPRNDPQRRPCVALLPDGAASARPVSSERG